MTAIQWDKAGDRLFETGVDRGVLYIPNNTGAYTTGFPWNGLTAVSESPSGAEPNPQYADNIKYLNLISAEEFGATIEAFTYPLEFAQCDGTALISGVQVAQQSRKQFGFSYRTLIGNDIVGTDFGYKIHLVYGCTASPSEKSRSTVNDSPEAATFSWEITTTPVAITGNNPSTGKPLRPTAHLVIDSTKVTADQLEALEELLYGTAGTDPQLPTPDAVLAAFAAGTIEEVKPLKPAYNETTKVITIPTVVGVTYKIGTENVTGNVTISEDTIVTAHANAGYKFPSVTDVDWLYEV